MGVEGRDEGIRYGMAGGCLSCVALFLEPLSAANERLGLHQPRIIMISELFLPDVERALSCVGPDEVEIAGQEIQHSSPERVIKVRLRVMPSRECQDLQRRSIILGTRPSSKIEAPIWIDSSLGQHRFAKDRGDLIVGPHILQEGGLNLFSEEFPTHKLASVQLADPQIKFDKLAQALDSNLRLEPLDLSDPQRVDDDRRISKPVEKIIGVGIVGCGDRRGQYGP